MKVKTLFIFEILGKPPEHLKESLGNLIDKLDEQKGVEIVRREVHEPKKAESKDKDGKMITSEDIYSTFAEIEVITDDIKLVQAIVLGMLPSHVEILEPTEFRLKNFELSSFFSDLTIKIHKYDEIAKIMLIERKDLIKELKDAQEKIRNLEAGIKKDKTDGEESSANNSSEVEKEKIK